ncbi:unnamed protein product [Brassica rapa subsp. trilocularis]|uniref:Uncharacterized protein n=1 Tax=Brassica campestris TaxID=3711 RepID=A0A3P6AV45_BRACM|nr:unnamed protein product [Brassica rapa]
MGNKWENKRTSGEYETRTVSTELWTQYQEEEKTEGREID